MLNLIFSLKLVCGLNIFAAIIAPKAQYEVSQRNALGNRQTPPKKAPTGRHESPARQGKIEIRGAIERFVPPRWGFGETEANSFPGLRPGLKSGCPFGAKKLSAMEELANLEGIAMRA
jgi:hypothetical protein